MNHGKYTFIETNTENKNYDLTNEQQIMADKLISSVKADRKARKKEIRNLTNDVIMDVFSALTCIPDVDLTNDQYIYLSKMIRKSLKSYRKSITKL